MEADKVEFGSMMVEDDGGTEEGRLGVGEELGGGISYLRTRVAFFRGFGADANEAGKQD